jgi:GR25 family glycosyltransferase involved in LPS biosynthesis
MLNIDTYIINMKSRLDRRALVELEMVKARLNPSLVKFQYAKYTPRNGAIGCALSHAKVLSEFLFSSNSEYCLILEDDFEIINPEDFNKSIVDLLKEHLNWDIVLLASNLAVPVSNQMMRNVYKVVHAQTTCAYLVKRSYAPTLIKIFFEAAEYLSEKYLRLDTKTLNYISAIDMAWKPQQLVANFYAFLPPLARQRESYSDIENQNVVYGV